VELELTDEQVLFAGTTRRFLEDTCPLTGVRALADDPAGFDPAWWRQGAELGWTSLLVPEARGGGSVSGEGLIDATLVAEERGRLVAPGPLVPVSVVAGALAAVSSHDDVLADLLSGEQVAGWCYLEPGRPLGKVATNVRLEGERVVLSGAKAPVEAAGVAGHLLVVAAGDEGLTEVLVPAGTPGVTVTPRQGIDLVRRFATVTFDEVDLPATALVGQPGGAGYQVERQLQVATVLTLAETLGALAAVFEFTTQWAFDRYSFGRPLASYQELKHRFADMALWLEASRATTAAAARAVQDDAVEAAELVSVAASYVGEHAGELVQDCVQMHGGIGVTWDHDIHLYLRRVTLNAAVYGTVADHRRRLAALVGLV